MNAACSVLGFGDGGYEERVRQGVDGSLSDERAATPMLIPVKRLICLNGIPASIVSRRVAVSPLRVSF